MLPPSPRRDPVWDDDAVILGRDDVSDFNEENILPQPPEVISRIRAWLKPTAYDEEGSEFRKHLASYLAGTGNWVLSSKSFQDWRSSREHGMLWIRGIPGSGKSVLTATLIDKLKKEGCPVLFFFFRQIIDANHSPIAALHDWLAQILDFSPPLQLKLKEHLDQARSLESLAAADLWRHLRHAMLYIPKVYCVVDALDEMDQNADLVLFLTSLAALGRWRPWQTKVLATSRPVSYIERPLKGAQTLHIRLEEDMVDADIATYVKYRLDKSSIPKDTHDVIRKAVPGRANGLFLYARLAMDAFLRPGADAEEVVRDLPQDMNVMYTDLLRDHARRSGVPNNIQLLIMQWVTHATRPLRLLEIAEVLNVTQYPPDKQHLKKTKDMVRAACGPLLEILPDETVSVVHHSLTEFLTGSTRKPGEGDYPILESGSTHNRLALVSLLYLQSGCLDRVEIPQKPYFSRRIEIRPGMLAPFTAYAAENWHVHARKATVAGYDQTEINGILDRFLVGKSLIKWAVVNYEDEPERITPAFAAVRLGLTEYLKCLLSRSGTDVNSGTREAGPPLCFAAKKGYGDMVEMLLSSGADMTGKTKYGETALILAAAHNQPHVIKILVEAGADPFESIRLNNGCADPPSTSRLVTPVSQACQSGHLESFMGFLPYIKTADEISLALKSAVTTQRHDIIRLLLEHCPVDVNAKLNMEERPPLFHACGNRDARSIEILLQAGADPNIKDDSVSQYRTELTPLLALANRDSRWSYNWQDNRSLENTVECFKLMLSAGADVSQVDAKGNTVLHVAEDPVIVRLLLDAGADPNATNTDGETPLHLCDNEDTIQLLLEDQDIDTEQKTLYGCLTPLLFALNRGHRKIALRLLEHGASAVAVDKSGHGAFHYAAQCLRKDQDLFERLVERLQEAGGNINLRSKYGRSPLHDMGCGIMGHNFQIIDETALGILLEAGADLEARDNHGQTPLFYLATSTSYTDGTTNCSKLLSAGARVDTRDAKGRTLFHAVASSNGCHQSAMFKLLMEHGLDPKQVDYAGNTVWHESVPLLAQRHWGVELPTGPPDPPRDLQLLEVNPLQPNHEGQTPLHMISMFQAGGLRENSRPRGLREGYSGLDYLIWLQRDVNQADNNGVTALHHASSFSEFNTQRLLLAGADASLATNEGLNALHIAARGRQPNIIGMLLDSLKEKTTPEVFKATVNAKTPDLQGTPLHFACASGRAESVKLLLEAGAAVDTEFWYYSPWRSCISFEDEDRNWPEFDEHSNIYAKPNSGSVTLEGKYRSPLGEGREETLERMDAIVELLASYGPESTRHLDDVIRLASVASCPSDYLVECLVRKREAMKLNTPLRLTDTTILSLRRRQANRDAVEDGAVFGGDGLQTTLQEFEILMFLKEYRLAIKTLQHGNRMARDSNNRTILHTLVVDGFASMLEAVADKHEVDSLDDHNCRESVCDATRYGPLLLEACRRKAPNMDVIRVLVEKVGVDVNAQTLKRSYAYTEGNLSLQNSTEHESALHILVKGEHWWQTTQALPYLIQHGADPNLKDADGLTPLHVALKNLGLLCFNSRAVNTLLLAGADVNTVDNEGRSALSCTTEDIKMTELLIGNGATVTHAALAAAISEEKPQLLEALLAHGADPNMRETEEPSDEEEEEEGEEKATNTDGHQRAGRATRVIRTAEMYPLHYAASLCGSRPTDSERQMIRILLKHGADPCARYRRTTVLHEIIASGRLIREFLWIPDLDLEARDAHGNTLFLAACAIRPADDPPPQSTTIKCPAEVLLDRGADPRARNNAGQSALHLFFAAPHSGDYRHEFFERLVALVPELVHAPDAAGILPLHLAVKASWGPRMAEAEVLLAAGADPRRGDGYGDTALHLAMRGTWNISVDGQVNGVRRDAVERLLSLGCDINARNKAGETPVFGFFRRLSVHFETEPPSQGMKAQEIADRAQAMQDRHGEEPLFSLLDEVGVDWTAVSAIGGSLLHIVAAQREIACWPQRAARRFQFLMRKGLDPAQEDLAQRTPLDIAATFKMKSVLDLFKRDGE